MVDFSHSSSFAHVKNGDVLMFKDTATISLPLVRYLFVEGCLQHEHKVTEEILVRGTWKTRVPLVNIIFA